MKVFNDLILVSKESILNKVFDIDMEKYEKLSDKEKEIAKVSFPTEVEKDFMTVYRSTAPQLARLQRKMSVCLYVEVLEFSFDHIIFTFAGNKYKIVSAKNAYRICKAIDKGMLEAVQELCVQGCVTVNDKPITDIMGEGILQIDEIQLLRNVAEKFFFQTFLV